MKFPRRIPHLCSFGLLASILQVKGASPRCERFATHEALFHGEPTGMCWCREHVREHLKSARPPHGLRRLPRTSRAWQLWRVVQIATGIGVHAFRKTVRAFRPITTPAMLFVGVICGLLFWPFLWLRLAWKHAKKHL